MIVCVARLAGSLPHSFVIQLYQVVGMTSFGWKQKKRVVQRDAASASAFAEESQVDPGEMDDDVDWFNNMPVKRLKIPTHTSSADAARLKEEGVALADDQRYKEAIAKWDEALLIAGSDERLLDMKAQALMELQESYLAVSTAEQAVSINPLWWVSKQTLGRALLNLGEVKAAQVAFQKAIHINPACRELWDEDLRWSCKVWRELKSRKSDAQSDVNIHARECMRIGSLRVPSSTSSSYL